MKNSILLIVSILTLSSIGCKVSVQEPVSAANPPKVEEKKTGIAACPSEDHFDDAGKVVATSGRWVWNKGKEAWEWATSEEMQKVYSENWEATKKFAGETWDSAVKSWDESTTDFKDEKTEKKADSTSP